MTVRELKKLINSIVEDDLDCECIMPIISDIPGMHAFEGVCSGVTEMMTLGPPPEFVGAENDVFPEGTRVLLIAPHSFHEENEHEDKGKEQLN